MSQPFPMLQYVRRRPSRLHPGRRQLQLLNRHGERLVGVARPAGEDLFVLRDALAELAVNGPGVAPDKECRACPMRSEALGPG